MAEPQSGQLVPRAAEQTFVCRGGEILSHVYRIKSHKIAHDAISWHAEVIEQIDSVGVRPVDSSAICLSAATMQAGTQHGRQLPHGVVPDHQGNVARRQHPPS